MTARAARRAPPRTISERRLTIAAILGAPALVYAVAFPAAHALGELPLLTSIAGALGSAVMLGRVVMPAAQIALFLISVLWLILSLTHGLPKSWTIFYEPGAAVRQWSAFVFMPLFVTAFYAVLRRFGAFIWRRPLMLILPLYVVSRIALVIGQEKNWEWDIVLYGVNSINIPIFIVFYVSVLSRQRLMVFDVLLVFAMACVCPTLTNLIGVASVLAIRVLPPVRKLVPASLAVLLITLLLIAPQFLLAVYNLDGDSGVRAVMWRDAGQAFVDTHGLGVGFGTEYITNHFGSIIPNWILLEDRATDRLYISTHSAFYDAALRMGAVGLLAFLVWMGRYLGPGRAVTIENAGTAAALACLLYVSLAFNPGLVATGIYIGMAMLVAALELLREGFDFVPVRKTKPKRFRAMPAYGLREVR